MKNIAQGTGQGFVMHSPMTLDHRHTFGKQAVEMMLLEKQNSLSKQTAANADGQNFNNEISPVTMKLKINDGVQQ